MKYEIHNTEVLQWAREYPARNSTRCCATRHITSPIGARFKAKAVHVQHDAPAKNARKRGSNKGGFMGKKWDGGDLAFRPETWAALGAHLHDGAFMMAFAGTRGYHRMAVAIEDAGFILHPVIVWNFATGFPKATRIDTKIDAAAGAEREVIGQGTGGLHHRGGNGTFTDEIGMA